MKNTIEENLRVWDEQHNWPKDGDEWDGQARHCNQPYEEWKKALVDTFIVPNISKDAVVAEIAPGHGRWTKEMLETCKEITLVVPGTGLCWLTLRSSTPGLYGTGAL